MSSWKKTWDHKINEEHISNDDKMVSSLKRKMKKIIKKRENPKNIPEFEDLYDRPQMSNVVEGFHINEYLEDVKRKVDKKKTPEMLDQEKTKKQENDVKKELDRLSTRIGSAYNKDGIDKSIDSLTNQLGSSVDSLSLLQDPSGMASSMGSSMAGDPKGASENVSSSVKVSSGGIQKTINSASESVNSVVYIITNFITVIGQKIQIMRIKLQLFLLKSNKYVKQCILRMANALTQNTATQKEIDIFQDQTQKFVTLLLVWYFVYNWYYIIFFLEEEDNVRYKLEFGELRKVSKYFYGFFGPALKPMELFNKGVLSMAILKKYLYTAVIMIMMFFVFYLLVENNFQTGLLRDFFGAINGSASMDAIKNPSFLSLFNIIIILYFSTSWFFGSMDDGNLDMSKVLVDGMGGGVWTLFFSIVIFVLAFICYYMWIMAVNVPMGMVMLTGYLVLYTFCGVLFYEGFNMFNIYTGISESLESVPPDLTPEPCKPNSPFFSLMWFKETLQWIIDILGKGVNFFSTNMFEVIILLTLIGGIGIYNKEWTSAGEGKVGTSVFQATNLSSVFKNLFAWLILINILLIIFLSMFLYNKWKLVNNLETSMKTDSSMLNQTSRSRMTSARGDNSAPVISKAKTNALKQKIAKEESKTEEEESKTEEEESKTEEEESNTEEEESKTEEEESKTEEPVTETKIEEPVTETKTEEPVTETKTEEPVTKTKTEEPVT